MNYKGMTKEQKDFCKGTVVGIYNSASRKVHSKRKAMNVCKTAFHSKYGIWPTITTSTIDTILDRAKNEDGIIIVPEATGKGMICTYGRGKNETPALLDHVNSISASQQKLASGTRNLRLNLVIPMALEMMPAAHLPIGNQKAYFEIVEDGNKAIANEIIKTEKIAHIKYKQVAYFVDEDGKEIEYKNNQIQ